MALPENMRDGLLPSEAEFIATSATEISIVPLMRIDRVRLLSGVYGPLRPPAQARVPLWMALSLKKRKRCSVVCPDWLQPENLRELHRSEIMNEEFAAVPLHYMAIAKVLLETAPDDIPQSDEVRVILKGLREARQSKVMEGIRHVNTEHLGMYNISSGEVAELRPFLGTAFKHLRAMQRAGEPDEEQSALNDQEHAPDRTHSWSLSSQQQGQTQQQTPWKQERQQQQHRDRAASAGATPAAPRYGASREESLDGTRNDRAEQRADVEDQDESQNNMDLF